MDQNNLSAKDTLKILSVATAVIGLYGWHKCSSLEEPPRASAPAPQKSAAQLEAEAKAAADGSFKRDVEYAGKKHVHDSLIKERRGSLPEHWTERAEMIKREGSHAIVLVHAGIKEGMLSDLVVVQNYVLSVSHDDAAKVYRMTPALRCGDQPTAAQIAALMITGGWPSAAANTTEN